MLFNENNSADRLIRLPQVLELVPVGKSTWWQGVASGRYPPPVKLGPKITAWKLSDIQKLTSTGLSNSNDSR